MYDINPDSLLRLRQIIGDKRANPPIPALVNISKSTWWSWAAAKIIPAPVRIGGATFWRAGDVMRLVDGAANDELPSAIQPVGSSNTGDATWKRNLRSRAAGGQP